MLLSFLNFCILVWVEYSQEIAYESTLDSVLIVGVVPPFDSSSRELKDTSTFTLGNIKCYKFLLLSLVTESRQLLAGSSCLYSASDSRKLMPAFNNFVQKVNG